VETAIVCSVGGVGCGAELHAPLPVEQQQRCRQQRDWPTVAAQITCLYTCLTTAFSVNILLLQPASGL
jgi:hypothetical protein